MFGQHFLYREDSEAGDRPSEVSAWMPFLYCPASVASLARLTFDAWLPTSGTPVRFSADGCHSLSP